MQIGDAKLALIWVIWGTKQLSLGISLVVPGLRLRPSNARGTDSVLDKGHKIPHGIPKKKIFFKFYLPSFVLIGLPLMSQFLIFNIK